VVLSNNDSSYATLFVLSKSFSEVTAILPWSSQPSTFSLDLSLSLPGVARNPPGPYFFYDYFKLSMKKDRRDNLSLKVTDLKRVPNLSFPQQGHQI